MTKTQQQPPSRPPVIALDLQDDNRQPLGRVVRWLREVEYLLRLLVRRNR